MTIVQKIVLGWFLFGLIGKILSRILFGEPKLEDAPENLSVEMQLGMEVAKEKPHLIFIVDLVLALLYAGQLSFIYVLKFLLITIPINLLQNIVIIIKNFFIHLRIVRQKKRLIRTYPLEAEAEIEERMTAIAKRWHNIYRKENQDGEEN